MTKITFLLSTVGSSIIIIVIFQEFYTPEIQVLNKFMLSKKVRFLTYIQHSNVSRQTSNNIVHHKVVNFVF